MDQFLADLVSRDLADAEEAFEKAVDKDYFRSLVEKKRAGLVPQE